ncbi:hypothetical protein [Spiroplasma sp. BIUS-1]|uniref:hypothetical protein n=1 Tax=Spiroplasma sp. BIUS-1 TaxID=216964 RepID=UPI0013970498|nr:hypothetical protein [Spiroplasma sp. BIUS-1]QHX36568.1 hypothetical protein SBIUS_v1c03150 [Spiroplasma sp. BIUS-1]
MKKLLTMLGVISMTASTFSVTSCSMVNLKKQSIKNKVENLMNISSTLLRGSIVQNASQDNASKLAFDSNYLNDLIGNSKANDLTPKIKTDGETRISHLHETYFDNQDLSRNAINNDLNNNFLTDSVKSPKSSLDKVSAIFVIISSVLKTNGGIHPSISGLIQGVIPELGLNDDLAEKLNPETINPIADLIGKLAVPLTNALGFLQNSNAFYSVLKNFFNSEFENAVKEKNQEEILKGVKNFIDETNFEGFDKVLDLLVNTILTMDKNQDELTGQMILNASLNRVNNIFARSSGQDKNIIADNKIYSDLVKNFDKNLGDVIGKFLKSLSNDSKITDFKSVITPILEVPENIKDLLFVIAGFLRYISSIDFSQYDPISDENLFSSSQSNNDFLSELNKKTLKAVPFKTEILLKNLKTITDTNLNKNGKQLQKLFYMLFNSGEKVTNIDENINMLSLISKISSPFIGQNQKNNYSSLLYGIGKGIAVWKGWSFFGIGGDQIGNLLRWVIGDGLGFNSDLSGLREVIEIIKGLGIEIDIKISDNSTRQLKHFFNALWDKDSTLLKDITGKQISLFSLFDNPVIAGLKISEIINLIYENIVSSGNEQENNGDKMKTGLNILSNSLKEDNYTLWYKEKGVLVPLESQYKKYNALQAFIISSSKNGVYLKNGDNEINENVKGSKAAMNALGTDYSSNGVQTNKFRQNSILAGVEYIFDDQITTGILDDVEKAFTDIQKINDGVSNSVYKKLIQDENFKTKLVSHSNIDEANKEQNITYKTTYIDPFTNKNYVYEIQLILKTDANSWKINSIKKI